MDGVTVTIYRSKSELPHTDDANFFHSSVLFRIYEQTPRMSPCMVTATTADGVVTAHILAVVRYRFSLFPPYIYGHCRVLGEGVYDMPERKDELFGAMLSALTAEMQGRALYIEFSHLSKKMFGYKQFHDNGYFPVKWMSVHNSLHSKSPEERVGARTLRRIEHGLRRGAAVSEVSSEDDFAAFMSLMRAHHISKPKRYIPDKRFFRGLMDSGRGKLFVTKYKGMTIGCCACAYSEGNAYLWYTAFKRKTFARLHPDAVTVWHAIKTAYAKGCAHIFFMDVGLPFRRNAFREFILRFGGKPESTYRYFRFSMRWLNGMARAVWHG